MKYIYLEDLIEVDLPTNAKKANLFIQQRPSSKNEFILQFSEYLFKTSSTIDEIRKDFREMWDKIHVFTYYDDVKKSEILIIKPFEVTYAPEKRFGFHTGMIKTLSNIPDGIAISSPIAVENEDDELGIYEVFMEKIINGGMPWTSDRNEAIIRMNDLNHGIKLISRHIPNIDFDQFNTYSLNEIFNKLYTIK